jgi:hypothetical protein
MESVLQRPRINTIYGNNGCEIWRSHISVDENSDVTLCGLENSYRYVDRAKFLYLQGQAFLG